VTRSITYDAGALILADRAHGRILAIHREALRHKMRITVPAGVLAQAWRGGPQPALSRILKGCLVEPLSEARARSAGHLCARAGTSDVIDATVVLGAGIRGDAVVTSDRVDIERLADALGVAIDVIDI